MVHTIVNELNKLDDHRHYYIRDNDNNPIGAVVIAKNDGVYVRGISVCSVNDRFSKTEAIKYAGRRVFKALKKGRHCERIDITSHPSPTSIRRFQMQSNGQLNVDGGTYLSQHDVALTVFEAELLSPPPVKNTVETTLVG